MNSGTIFLKTIFRNDFKLLPTVMFTDTYVIQHFIGLKKKKTLVKQKILF